MYIQFGTRAVWGMPFVSGILRKYDICPLLLFVSCDAHKLILLCSAWEAAAMREPLAPVHTVHSIVIGSLRVSEASQQRSGLSDQSAMYIALTSYSKRRVQIQSSNVTCRFILGLSPLITAL